MEPEEHNNTALRLEELKGSDFEIVDDQPDIIGWQIVDAADNEIGEVEDLIFDREARKVRYLVSVINAFEDQNARLVLIPIGVTRFDEDEDEVIIPEISAGYLSTIPTYKKGTVVSPAEELAVRFAFLGEKGLITDSGDAEGTDPAEFYTHPHFNDDHFKKRNI